MGESEEYKQCFACAEDIKAKAVICRYCRTPVLQYMEAKDGKFISIINTTRETELDELEIGYMAINKSVIEWICMEKEESEDGSFVGRSIY